MPSKTCARGYFWAAPYRNATVGGLREGLEGMGVRGGTREEIEYKGGRGGGSRRRVDNEKPHRNALAHL